MRVLYEVDPFNRLIVKRPSGKGKSKLKRFRQVVYGHFKTDNKNALSYEVSKSSGIDVPQRIKFSGTYSLNKRHNLILTLNKWNNQCEGNRLRLKTKIMDANGSEIVFLLSSKISEKGRAVRTLKLHGSWQADKNNRLTFGIKKEHDKTDNLTLFNAWKINKNNEIVYSYGQDSQVFILRGHWHIKDRYRLGYILDKRINSGFNFRTSLGQIVPKGKKTYVKFDVAVEISKKKRIRRRIIFTCRSRLEKGGNVVLEVLPRQRSATLKLTKEVLNQKGLAYIESSLKDKERYSGGGLTFRW